MHLLTLLMRTFNLTQQRKYPLRQLVRLGNHGCARLLQDLRARQVGGFCSEVGILNTATRSRHVFGRALQVVHCRFEAGLQGTEAGALAIDGGQSLVNDL